MASRAKTEIAYSILKAIEKDPLGQKPTHIIFKANLSKKLLDKYITVMLADDLVKIVIVNNKTRYKITKKGLVFKKLLQKVDIMTQLLNYSEI